MYFRNAGYPNASRVFAFDNDSAEIWFPFIGEVQGFLPTGDNVSMRGTFQADGACTTDTPGYVPNLLLSNNNEFLLDLSIPAAPSTQAREGNEWYQYLPMGQWDIDNQFGHIGLCSNPREPNMAAMTATFNILFEISTDGLNYVPLSDYVDPSQISYDNTLFEFVASSVQPVGNCFWTDKVGVYEDCGATTSDGVSVAGVIFETSYGVQVYSSDIDWSGGVPPTFYEGTYGPQDAINLMAGSSSRGPAKDFCDVMKTINMVGDRFVVTNQTLECGSFYYASRVATVNYFGGAIPPSATPINADQSMVVEPTMYFEGSISTSGAITNATMYFLVNIDDSVVSGINESIGSFSSAGSLTLNEANSTKTVSAHYEESIPTNNFMAGIGCNGNGWIGGAGSYSADLEAFFRPPMYGALVGHVDNIMYYPEGEVTGTDSYVVESPTPGTPYNRGRLLVLERAYYYPPDASLQRYGYNYSAETPTAPGDPTFFDTGAGVLVGDLYSYPDGDSGNPVLIGKIAFNYQPGS